jgi:hypothetical protein
VFADGKKIYSKKATGKFPEYSQVKTALEKSSLEKRSKEGAQLYNPAG